MGTWLTVATIWVSLAAYAASTCLCVVARPWARWLWGAGWLACVVHVVLAFHVFHHWSHAEAYVDTARQTAEVTGLDWGGGIWINYLFVAVWGADVGWWWMFSESYQRRPAWVSLWLHGFILFMIFNATVVFGDGAARWAGVVLCGVAVTGLARNRSLWRRGSAAGD